MQRILFIILCFLFLGQSLFSRELTGSPYAIFGDSTIVLDVNLDERGSSWFIIITMYNDSTAVMEINDGTLIIKDSEERIISSNRINKIQRALFTCPDPKSSDMTNASPYVYCFSNPILYIDKDGQRPSKYQAALMASAVYKDEYYSDRIKKLADFGWIISNEASTIKKNHSASTGIGIQSMLFERTTDGEIEYAYVFAGTYSWEDCVEDVLQPLGITGQYKQAIDNSKQLNQIVGDKELTFVGHSLGGGEAAAASMATGRAAMTFNSAVVSPLTITIQGLFKTGNITNYISSTPKFGGIHRTVDYITLIQNALGLTAPGKCVPISVGYLPTHSINDIVKALAPK